MRKPFPALALGTVIVLVAGCGGTSTSSTTAGSSGGASSGGGGTTLNIVEKEFSLSPSALTLTKPGTYTINGINKGTMSHAIAIDGQGVDKTGSVVGPGGTSTITVSITKPGKYDLFCPVGSHRQAGMQGTLTLGSGSSGGMGGGTTTDSSGGYGY
jgi:plastocyanin